MPPDPKPVTVRRAPRRGRHRRDERETEMSEEWHRRAVVLGCRVCPELGQECEGGVQGHHVLYQQHIRAYVDAVTYERMLTIQEHAEMSRNLLWDHRNAMGLCKRIHQRHHSRLEPILLSLVPMVAITFAAELGLGHRIESAYTHDLGSLTPA